MRLSNAELQDAINAATFNLARARILNGGLPTMHAEQNDHLRALLAEQQRRAEAPATCPWEFRGDAPADEPDLLGRATAAALDATLLGRQQTAATITEQAARIALLESRLAEREDSHAITLRSYAAFTEEAERLARGQDQVAALLHGEDHRVERSVRSAFASSLGALVARLGCKQVP